MPTRILRDWTWCEKMNMLSIHAEWFYIRLMMKVDDHGIYYADTKQLKKNLFPLKETFKEPELLKYLDECQKAKLITVYEHEGKRYLQITDFNQRKDRAKSKFPLPDENQLVDFSLTVVNGRERKKEEGIKPPEEPKEPHTQEEITAFTKFTVFILTHAPTVAKMKEPFTIKEFLEIKKEFKPEFVKDMILRMHNWKLLLTKNTSANLTFKNWSKKPYNQEPPPETTKPNLADAVKKLENGTNE